MTASITYLPPLPEKSSAKLRGSDEWGSGHFMAPRGNRKHNGIDFLVPPLSTVYSTVTGIVTKLGICYRGGQFRYVQVDDIDGYHVRHFYVDPSVEVGDIVNIGDPIGRAQNLTKRYPADQNHKEAMPNHIHLEIVRPGTLYSGKEFINPDLYIFT